MPGECHNASEGKDAAYVRAYANEVLCRNEENITVICLSGSLSAEPEYLCNGDILAEGNRPNETYRFCFAHKGKSGV